MNSLYPLLNPCSRYLAKTRTTSNQEYIPHKIRNCLFKLSKLEYLLSQEEHVSVKQISKLFNISEKTIYRDLDSIQDKVLKENMSIEKIPGKGIKIVGKAQDKMNVNLELRNNNEVLEETSVQERRAKILLDLFIEIINAL